MPGPWVIKTDGLAAGKGVLVARTLEDARADVTAKLSGAAFGEAGRNVVIEEGLDGEECSLLVLCDGTRAVPLVPAQDFKRVGDGDSGPNTGGMGAYSPMPQVRAADVRAHHGHRGAAAGRGTPPPWHRLPGRPLCRPHADRRGPQGDRVQRPLRRSRDAGGPPAARLRPGRAVPRRGERRAGRGRPAGLRRRRRGVRRAGRRRAIPRARASATRSRVCGPTANPPPTSRAPPSSTPARGGTSADGPFHTAGGRVLGVTAIAPTLAEARDNAYAAAAPIEWEGMQLRHDIAAQAAGAGVSAREAVR